MGEPLLESRDELPGVILDELRRTCCEGMYEAFCGVELQIDRWSTALYGGRVNNF